MSIGQGKGDIIIGSEGVVVAVVIIVEHGFVHRHSAGAFPPLAVVPEDEGIVVGRIGKRSRRDKILQRRAVGHVQFAQVLEESQRPFFHFITFRCSAVRIVLHDDGHVLCRADFLHCFEIKRGPVAQIIVGVKIDHQRPLVADDRSRVIRAVDRKR